MDRKHYLRRVKYLIAILTVFWSVFLLSPVSSQSTSGNHAGLPFDQYSLIRNIGDIPDSDLKNIVRDDLGYLWMNTEHHLVRFDGNGFLILESQPRSQFRLSGTDVKNIGTDPLGNIVVCYASNNVVMDVIDPVSLKITPIKLDTIEATDVWIGEKEFPTLVSNRGDSIVIYQLDHTTLRKWRSFRSFQMGETTDLKIGGRNDNNIWLYQIGSFFLKVTSDGIVPIDWPAPFSIGGLSFFSFIHSGEALFSYNDYPGLYSLDVNQSSPVLETWVPTNELYGQLWEDEVGNILLSVKADFKSIKKHLVVTLNGRLIHDYSLVEHSIFINDLYAQNLLEKPYFATYRGLYVAENENARFKFFLNQEVPNNQFGAVLRGLTEIDTNVIAAVQEFDTLSILNLDSGILRNKQIILYNQEDSVEFNMSCASNLKFDEENLLWGSSCDPQKNAYLYSYDLFNDTIQTYLCFKNSLITDFEINSVDSIIWLAMRYQGKDGILGRFDLRDKTFQIEKGPIDPIFKGNIPNYIYASSDSILFLASDKGLVKYNIFSQVLTLEYPDLKDQKLYCIIESSTGQLIAGGYNGLFIIDSLGEVTTYSREQGINSRVASIIEDQFGNLWIGTFNGLLYLDLSLGIVSNYTIKEGLISDEFNTRSFCSGVDNYFFGTINGLLCISKIKEEEQFVFGPQILQIRKLNSSRGTIIQRSNLNDLKKLVIEPSDISVNISVFNPYFLSQQKESFVYKLEGIDVAWTPLALNEDIQLEKLPPGEYTLRVRMKKDNGLWSQDELTLPIQVNDVFYKSTWFLISALIVGSGFFGLIIHYYNVKSRQKVQEENEIKQRFAELELHALRAQMNPHFIFNSLNAIQYFIQTNNRRQSDEYISKFAHLIRLFLNASTKKYISLDEEIKVVKAYVELERLRFRGKLNSEFQIEESLNSMETIIPSMLIQPFVENAINHGIFHKNAPGTVKLSIRSINDDMIECIIEDDGIGRERARQIKEKSIGKYESKGISIIDDRIHVLKRSLNQAIDYQIIDLKKDNIPTGTKVVLTLPIIE